MNHPQRKAKTFESKSVRLRACCVTLAALALTAAPPIAAETPATNAKLPLRVAAALKHRDLPPDTFSAVVHNLTTGQTALAWHADVARNPASVMKLVTTLVALDVLGPAYTWRTEAYARGMIEQGQLDGDLLLKGYGDPFLVTERVWQMLRQLRGTGLETIAGDLLLDDGYFAVEDYDPAAFDGQGLRAYNVGPNALLMNFKAVRYFFEPAAEGSDVRIRLDPELGNLKVVNRLSLTKGACRGYQRGIAIIPNDAVDEITFSGRFPSGCRVYSMTRAALDHNAFTYGLFTRLWRDLGGTFEGGFRNVAGAPESANADEEPLLSFESWPLAEVISRVNKHSNNVMARHLLLTLAAETYGAPGSEAAGRRAISEWLEARGFASGRLKLANGSGLSRSGRITAEQLAALLRYAYAQPYMPEFLASMSVTGLDGTTSRRFRQRDSLTGRARVKTGSLDHVSAIAGYLQSHSGDRYVVVTLQNHDDVHRGTGEEVQEALLRWVYER